MDKLELIEVIYDAAYNTGRSFVGEFGGAILYLVGAIIHNRVADGSELHGFLTELPGDIREELTKYLV